MKKVRGTKAQHQALDADYKKWLAALDDWNFWGKLGVLQLWGEEKAYLSEHGQRYVRITNIGRAARPAEKEPK